MVGAGWDYSTSNPWGSNPYQLGFQGLNYEKQNRENNKENNKNNKNNIP